MRSSLLTLIAPVVFLTLYTGCTRPENYERGRIETRTLELKPGGHLVASTFNGSISVEGWDKDEVSLVAKIRERREGEVSLITDSKNGRVEIRAEREPERGFVINFGSSGASYTLQIPRKTVTTLVTSNGRLEISRIDNEIDATTSNGSITVDEIGGNTQLTTSNGAVRASSIKGELIVTTSNGKIDIGDVSGEIELRTTNGKIIAHNIKGNLDVFTRNASIVAENIEGNLTGSSTNGRIELQKVLGQIDLTTTNGSIKAADLNGKGQGIRLITSNGSMDITLGQAQGELEAYNNRDNAINIEIPNIKLTRDGSSTQAKIGDGSQPIELRTSNGKITVRKD